MGVCMCVLGTCRRANMSDLLHKTDRFGNDIWLGDSGDVKMAALAGIDYSTHLSRIRDVELRPDDVILVGFPKSGRVSLLHFRFCFCLLLFVCLSNVPMP